MKGKIRLEIALSLFALLAIVVAIRQLLDSPPAVTPVQVRSTGIAVLQWTAEEEAWLEARESIRLAPDPNFPPLEYFDETGVYRGLVADLMEPINESLRGKLRFVRLPDWARVLDAARARDVDGITAAQKTPSRQEYLDFSLPLIDIPNVIIMRAGTEGVVSFTVLTGMRVAVTEGNALHEYIRQRFPEIVVVPVRDDLTALREVSFGRVDATVINQAIASWLIDREGIVNLRIVGDSGRSNPLSIATRNDQPILQRIMTKALLALPAEKKEKILARWLRLPGVGDGIDRDLWRFVLIASCGLLVVVLVIMIWNRLLHRKVRLRTGQLADELVERRRVETRLQATLDTLRRSQQTGRIGDWMLLPETGSFQVSPVVREIFGFADDATLSFEDFLAHTHSSDRDRVRTGFTRMVEGGMPYDIDYRIEVPGSDQRRYVHVHAETGRDADGRAKMISGICQDVTARHLAEESLRINEEALRRRLIALTQPFDDPGDILFEDLFDIDEIQELQDAFSNATNVASIITRADGQPITKPSNFCRLCKDIIRETKKGRRNCYRSDASIGRYNAEGPTVCTCLSGGLWDAGASITVGGKHIANWLIGQVRNEANDLDAMLAYADEIGVARDVFREALAEVPEMSREQFVRVAQSLFSFSKMLSLKAYQNVQQARFITERQAVEKALRESEAKYRFMTENVNDVIWQMSADMIFTYVSPADEHLRGFRADEVVGRHLFEFLTPDSRKALESVLAQRMNEYREGEVSAGGLYENEMFCRDGSTIFYEVITNPVFGPDGVLTGYQGVSRDISLRKKADAERERLIRELEGKNTELERFTYTVSHDLKSPLITIKGFVDSLRKDILAGQMDRVEKDVDWIGKAADRMTDLLGDLLELSRVGRRMKQPSAIALDTIVHEALLLVEGRIRQSSAAVEVASGMPHVMVDKQRIVEVFLNLIDNAIKYARPDASPRIRIEAGEIPGGRVRVSVRDNGQGIDPRYHESVFGLFDKIDVRSEGTGIGLALVKRIVEVHGGTVAIESSGQDSGTTFVFTLPLAVSPDADRSDTPGAS